MSEHTLARLSGGHEATLGAWLDGLRRFVAFTLEDEHRKVKVPGETCIPAGRYRLLKWTEPTSDFRERQARIFPDIDRGFVIEISGVENFTAVLVHWGNTDLHTRGCVLVGNTSEQNITERGRIGASRDAYRRWYPPIAAELERGEEVWLNVVDIDDPIWRGNDDA